MSFCTWSDGPPIVEASGQVDIFLRPSGQADLWSDVPPVVETSGQGDIFVQSLGQTDLWSDVPGRLRLPVRLTILSDLWVMLTFSEMYPPGSGCGSG